MSLCPSDCAVLPPASYGAGCDLNTRPAGIKQIGFITCDVDVASLDFTQQSTWDTLCQTAKLAISGKLLADKPKGSPTKKKIFSCSPEFTTGYEKTVNFEDYNADSNNQTREYDFWNAINADPSKFYMFYITCDNALYGPFSDFVIDVDDQLENDSKEYRKIMGSIMWNQKEMQTPVYLSASISIKCDESSVSGSLL